jgi:hypothetical protein
MDLFHYTDATGFKGISSSPTWRFLAAKPPGDHARGAYFTDYDEHTPLLAHKLRIPKKKIEFQFWFTDGNDVATGRLKRLEGGRGRHIFFSPSDYAVPPAQQVRSGPSWQGGAE